PSPVRRHLRTNTARFAERGQCGRILHATRRHTVKVKLASKPASKFSHLLVDSTGLEVFGEGEWKVRTHGKGKRRQWRKLRISMDGVCLLIICGVVKTRRLESAFDEGYLLKVLNS